MFEREASGVYPNKLVDNVANFDCRSIIMYS